MARDLNIFISHSWGSHDELLRLRNLLNARPYFRAEFSEVSKDIPINSVNADYIKRVLGEKIRNSNVLLAIAGIYASHSTWMEGRWTPQLDMESRYWCYSTWCIKSISGLEALFCRTGSVEHRKYC